MRLILCGQTALNICNHLAASPTRLATPCRIRSLAECVSAVRDVRKFNLSEIESATGPEALCRPWHIMVSGNNDRSRTKGLERHMWSGPIPDGAFYRIGEGVYISSPEFSIVLLSAQLSLIDIVLLCCESCGRYVRDPSHPKGFYKRPAITNRAKIKSFIEKLKGAKGVKKLRRALKYAFDNSYSPMETAISLLASMPVRMGGYGLPKPELNVRVNFTSEIAHMAGKPYVKYDLYFRGKRVVVEYNSDDEHTGAERISSDSRRNNAIGYLGEHVMTITWDEVKRASSCDDAMKQLSALLDRKLAEPSDSALAKRRHLRATLLPPVAER